jgi:hypothetical protein
LTEHEPREVHRQEQVRGVVVAKLALAMRKPVRLVQGPLGALSWQITRAR